MAHRMTRRWLAGAGAAVGLGGALAFAGTAGAQPSPAPPNVVIAAPVPFNCALPAPPPGSPAAAGTFVVAAAPAGAQPGAGPALTAHPAPGTFISREQFAAQLAKALGKSEAEVLRVLDEVERDLPRPDAGGIVSVGTAHADLLAPVAARLGVSTDDLLQAMKAAGPPCPTTPPQPGTPVTIRFDADAFFAAVAAELGRGITAEQVREAFEAERPAAPPAMIAVRFAPEQFEERLARALGVTVEQLRAALKSIQPALAGPRSE